MVRTQVQLTEKQALRLRRAARDQGVSLAEVVRRCIDRGLDEAPDGRTDRYVRAARWVGAFPDTEGVADLASEHDRYLEQAFR